MYLSVNASVIVERTSLKYLQTCWIPRKHLLDDDDDSRWVNVWRMLVSLSTCAAYTVYLSMYWNLQCLSRHSNRSNWQDGDLVSVQFQGASHLCKLVLNDANDCVVVSDIVTQKPSLPDSPTRVLVQKLSSSSTAAIVTRLELDLVLDGDRIHDIALYENPIQLQHMIRSICRMFVLCDGCDLRLGSHDLLKDWAITELTVLSTNTDQRPGVVTAATDILIRNIRFGDVLNQIDEPALGGLSSIQSAIDVEIRSGCNVLLVGPSGCGKTSLVMQVRKAWDASIFKLECSPVQVVTGENALLERMHTFGRLSRISTRPTILLVEDAEQFAGQPSFLQGLDRLHSAGTISVICTTRNAEAVSPKLRRPGRVDRELFIKVPSEEQRREIVRTLLATFEPCHAQDRRPLVELITIRSPAFLGGDLVELFKLAKRFAGEQGAITEAGIRQALLSVRPVSVRTNAYLVQSDPAMRLECLGGLLNLKKTLDMSIFKPLAHPERFLRFGLSLPKGILMYGPPGCAKTTVAKCLANEMNRHLISVSAAQIYSPYVGDSEQLLAQLFHQARMSAPSIIFIDEIGKYVLLLSQTQSYRLPVPRCNRRLSPNGPKAGQRCSDQVAVHTAD